MRVDKLKTAKVSAATAQRHNGHLHLHFRLLSCSNNLCSRIRLMSCSVHTWFDKQWSTVMWKAKTQAQSHANSNSLPHHLVTAL